MPSILHLPKVYHHDFRVAKVKPNCRVEIDWNEPLSDALEALFICDNNVQMINLINSHNSLLSTDYTNCSLDTVGAFGPGVSTFASGSDSDGLGSGFRLSSTSKYTIANFGRIDTVSATIRYFCFGQHEVGAGGGYDGVGQYYTSAGAPYFFPKNGSNIAPTTNLSNGDIYTWAGSYDAGVTNGTKVFVNGVRENQSTISGAAGSAYDFSVGRRWSNNDAVNTTQLIIPIWGRVLSEEELAEWDRDPFRSLLKPVNQTIYFIPESSGTNINATLETLTLTEFAASINAQVNITANLEQLTLTEFNSDTDLDKNISATTESLTLTEFAATITTGLGFVAETEQLSLTEFVSSINAQVNIDASLESLQITEFVSDTDLDKNISATLEALTLSEFSATITAAQGFTTNIESLLLTEYSATITSTGAVWTVQPNDSSIWTVQSNDSSSWTVL